MKKMVAVLSTFFLAAIFFCFPVGALGDGSYVVKANECNVGRVSSGNTFFATTYRRDPTIVYLRATNTLSSSYSLFDYTVDIDPDPPGVKHELNYGYYYRYQFELYFTSEEAYAESTYVMTGLLPRDGSSVEEVRFDPVRSYRNDLGELHFVYDFLIDGSKYENNTYFDMYYQYSRSVNYFRLVFTDITVTYSQSEQGLIDGIVDGIGDKLDENTDKFINGDGTPLAPNVDQDLDNKSDEMGQLENEALGGKSDEEIQQEVDNALSFDVGSLDSSATGSMSGFFDDLLGVFGADYQALLMLALSLGLAAFILGRRYS